jgi:hypothetical protein
MPSSSGQQTSTQSTKVELPQWVDDAAQKNLGIANTTADNLQGPYTGQRVADMTGAQVGNIQGLQNNVGSTNGAFNTAQSMTTAAGGATPGNVTAGSFLTGNLSGYMNPYTSNVIDATNAQAIQGLHQTNNVTGAAAQRAGAFGGSRQGVAEGVNAAQTGMGMNTLTAQLQGQNFSQAQAAMAADQNRALTADQGNQSTQTSNANRMLNAGGQLGNLATQGQASFLQGNQAAMAGQSQLQAQQQQQLDAQRALYGEQANYPLQQLQIRQSGLSATPYGQTTNGTSTTPTTQNGFMQMAGLGLSGASALGSLGGSTGLAGLLAI